MTSLRSLLIHNQPQSFFKSRYQDEERWHEVSIKGDSRFSGRYVLFWTLLLTSVILFIQGTCISWNNPVLSISRISSLNYKNITEMLILWDPDCILDCFFQWGVGQNFIIPQVPILGWEYSHRNFHCWKLLANTEVNSRSNRWARNSHCHCLAVGDCPLLDLNLPEQGNCFSVAAQCCWLLQLLACEPKFRSYCFTWGRGKRKRESKIRKGTACFVVTQDRPIVQGLGQQALALTGRHVCGSYILKSQQQRPTMEPWNLSSALFQVYQEMLFILYLGQLCDSIGQVVPQQLLGLPDSCTNNIFASNRVSP